MSITTRFGKRSAAVTVPISSSPAMFPIPCLPGRPSQSRFLRIFRQFHTCSYLNDTLVNAGATIDSVMYSVTPHNNDCSGFDTLFTVLVYPLPVLTNSTLVKSICDSTALVYPWSPITTPTAFTWTCTASSDSVSGYSNNTATPDTVINQLLRNTGYDIDTVYYHLLPQSYGCFGDTITIKVAVYPVPDMSNSPVLQTQCNGQATGLTLQSNINGTTFTWSAFASSGEPHGIFGNSGPGAITINQTLTNSGYGIDTVTYRLMPFANGCYGDSTDYRVVVFPTPDFSNSPTLQSQCNGDFHPTDPAVQCRQYFLHLEGLRLIREHHRFQQQHQGRQIPSSTKHW